MPEDIVIRLRTMSAMTVAQSSLPLLEEAADEIMRLRSKVASLKGMIEEFDDEDNKHARMP